MEWKHLFSRAALERGRQYFLTKQVGNYRKKNQNHVLSVRGTQTYTVTLQFQDGEISRMGCNCPNARDGFRCKHMAAALFYLEDENVLGAEELFPIQQLTMNLVGDTADDSALDAKDRPYSYFDCDAMKEDFSLSASQMQWVQELVEKGLVTLDSVHIGYHGSGGSGSDHDELRGTAIGTVKEEKSHSSVALWFEKAHISQAECWVPGCVSHYQSHTRYGKRNLCVHQVALLTLLEQYLYMNNLGDSTTREGALFLERYRCRRRGNEVDGADGNGNVSRVGNGKAAKQVKLTFQPRLQVYHTEWTLSFKIVGNKSFVVKDMSELIGQVENRESVKFGTSTEWLLGEECFSEQALRYYRWIRQVVLEEKERRKAGCAVSRYYYDDDSGVKDSLRLYGRRLDEFFDAVGDDSIEWIQGYGSEKKTVKLTCRERKPEITLVIRKYEDKKNVFQGIRLTGSVPELLYTPQAAYFIDEVHLNRVSDGILRELKPVLDLSKGGDISTRIGRKHLGEFYHYVLPVLREHVSVAELERDEIAAYIPPEVSFAFYLDVEEGDIFCRGEAVYGEKRISLAETAMLAQPSLRFEEFRDMERERNVMEQMFALLPHLDETKACFCCDGEEEAIYRLLSGGIDELLKLGEVHVTDRLKRMNIRRRPNLSVGVAVESQLLNLSVSSEEISLKELMEVLDSYKRKKRFHRLKNGDFFNLEDENETLELLDQLLVSAHIPVREFVKGKMEIPVYRALYLDKMLEACEGAYIERDRNFKNLVRDFKVVEDADFEVPVSLQKTLRKYQETGYRWLRTLDTYGFGGILADDMGLGKTLQVIALLLSPKGNGTAVVITPASLVYNWGEEFKRYAPELNVCLVTGTQKERYEHIKMWQRYDVLVTSYDLLKRDIAEYEDCEFAYEILDEAQYIKNHMTAVAKAVKVVHSRQRFALTGTPIENRLSELWSIFDYLMPGYLYSYEGFRKEFEMPIVKQQDDAVSKRLKRMVSPFILRRLKTQVLKDLPDKLEEVRYVKPEAEQKRLLDGQVAHMRSVLEKTDEADFGKSKLKILAELMRVRQICCDPSLCFDDYHGGSAKREACVELIQNAIAGEHKILVFSQFTSMLELLEHDLAELGISFYKITGETAKEERIRLVNAYNQDGTPVFLISLKAGGTGLNLTGADMVIHYDPWWNLAVQNQATDRAHRIGQTRVVTVYKMIVKDSIEERILMMQETKKNLADEILSGENGSIGNLSKEELLELLM